MADQYDGKVVINTSLDNSGFDKGSKELEAAIKELTAEVKALGQNMQASFEKYAQSIQGAITSTNAMHQSMEQTQSDAQQTGQALKEAEQAAQEFQQTGSKPVSVESSKKSVSGLEKEITSLSNQVAKLGPLSEQAANGSASAANRLKTGYDSALKKLDELEAKTAELGKQKFETEDFKWYRTEAEKVSKALEKLQDRKAKLDAVGASTNSQGYKSLEYDIKQATANLQDLQATMKEMQADGTSHIAGIDTEQYKQARSELEGIKATLREIKAGSVEPLPDPDPQRRYEQMPGTLARVRNGFGSLMRTIGSGLISGIKSVSAHSLQAAKNLGMIAGQGILSGIKRLGSAMAGLGKSTKSSNGGFAGGLKTMLKYGLGIRSVFVLVNKLRQALISGWGTLAQYDAGFNSTVSSFVSALMTLGNAFAGAFAPVLEVVLPILTTLINALAEAVNRIGMMIAALCGKNSFMKATKVQYDFAKAQQKGTKGASGAADALEDEADAAQEAKKQLMGFDDVNILSEDKDTSKNKKGKGSGADGNGVGGFEEVPFDETAADWAQMLKDAWDKADFTEVGRKVGEALKKALDSIPWEPIKEAARKIAKCIATFLNGFLETPGLFDSIGKTIAEALNTAFEFVDSFVENFRWDSLGKAIRDGILGFVKNIDWPLINKTFKGLGTGIGKALNAALANDEIWTGCMTALSSGLNAVVMGLTAFFDTVDWGQLGKSIATGINTGIANIDWTGIGNLLISSINSLFDLLYNFMTTFDFWAFGNSVGTGISTAIRGINWFEGAYSVGAAITGLFQTLNGFMEGIDWGSLGAAVIQTIAGFFQGLDWSAFSEFLSNVWKGLFNFFSGAVSEINWEEIGDYIIKAICDFFTGFDWSGTAEAVGKAIASAFTAVIKLGGWLWNKMVEFGKSIIEGGWKGITDKIASVGSWIRQNILDPFVKGFKDAFGIHSPSRVMAEQGGFLIDGLLKGIKDTWHNITDFFSRCGQSINQAIQNVGSWFENAGEWIVSGIQRGISNAWDGLCTTVSRWCSDLWGSVTSFFQIGSPSKLMEKTVGVWIPRGMAVGIEKTAGEAVDAVQTMAEAVADEAADTQAVMPIETAFDEATSGLDGVLGTFADKVTSSFQTLLSGLSSLVADQSFRYPNMALGGVTPYSTSAGKSGNSAQDIADALTQASSGMTKEELRSLISELGRKIDSISFYIGDQDLARHVNKGNDVLGRRFQVGG